MKYVFLIASILIIFILIKGILTNELDYRINKIIKKVEDKK